MENLNGQPEIFMIRRKTPRARGLSWGGTICFGLGILTSGYFWLISQRYSSISDAVAFRFGVFITMFFLIAIIMWGASSKAQNGTITITEDRISCKCERTFLDILPGQVSSVSMDGNVVKIQFCGKTLTVKAEKATRLKDSVQDFINAYKYSGNFVTSVPSQAAVSKEETKNEPLSADRIREYKQLVDDGVITQEQFNQIIDKLTKMETS